MLTDNELTGQSIRTLGSPVLMAIALALWVSVQLSVAADESKKFHSADAVSAIRQAKIIDPKCAVKAALTSKEEATVVVQRNAKETDEDCKIDAILIARALMDDYPTQLVRVKVMFYSADEDGKQVSITAGDIRSFKSGQLDKKVLLDSIEMIRVSSLEPLTAAEPGQTTTVIPGPNQPGRLFVLEHINRLAQVGVNVKLFMDEFNEIEKMIGTPSESEIRSRLLRLQTELKEQDQLTWEAQHPFVTLPRQRSRARNSFGQRTGAADLANGSGKVLPAYQRNSQLGGLTDRVNGGRGKIPADVRIKLMELVNQGKDISAYTKELAEIKKLYALGNDQEANILLDQLKRSLGM